MPLVSTESWRCLTPRWNGLSNLHQRQEIIEKWVPGMTCEGTRPCRLLVPAAQAQAARRR